MSVDFTIRGLPEECLCWGEASSGPVRTSTFRTNPACPVHVERTDLPAIVLVRAAEGSPAPRTSSAELRASSPTPAASSAGAPGPGQAGQASLGVDLRLEAARIHEARGHDWPVALCSSCQDRAARGH